MNRTIITGERHIANWIAQHIGRAVMLHTDINAENGSYFIMHRDVQPSQFMAIKLKSVRGTELYFPVLIFKDQHVSEN